MAIYSGVIFLTLFFFTWYHLILAARGVRYINLLIYREQLMKKWEENIESIEEILLIKDAKLIVGNSGNIKSLRYLELIIQWLKGVS